MNTIFILFVLFQLKHFLFDFVFQGKYELGKFSADWSFICPLLVHCWKVSLPTAFIAVIGAGTLHSNYTSNYLVAFGLCMFVVDFVTHFFIDRLKAGPKYLGRYKDMTKSSFWICLGLDQMLHNMVYIGITWYITKG